MTREELIELAALDALGMLDEYESALYTRSFHHAPAAVQEEIIQLQAQIADDESLLGDEEPTPDLRDRVLQAVSHAIDEDDSSRLAPIATIGRRNAVAASTDEPDERRVSRWNTAPYWRAACFVLCGGLIVVSYFLAEARTQSNLIAQLALGNQTDQQLETLLGPSFREFMFRPGTEKIDLVTANGDVTVRAFLLINESMDQAILVTDGLERSVQQAYRLTVKSSDGRERTAARMYGNGGVDSATFAVADLSLSSDTQWALHGPDGLLLMSA